MKLTKCTACGSIDMLKEDGFFVCAYCRLQFIAPETKSIKSDSNISVHSDIQSLLEKCRRDPLNSRRIANLILDLDPTNTEARMYL